MSAGIDDASHEAWHGLCIVSHDITARMPLVQDAQGTADNYWVMTLAHRNEQYKKAVRDMQQSAQKAHERESDLREDLRDKHAAIVQLKVSSAEELSGMNSSACNACKMSSITRLLIKQHDLRQMKRCQPIASLGADSDAED